MAALQTHGLGRALDPYAAPMYVYGHQPQAYLARGVDAYVLQGHWSHNLAGAQYEPGYNGLGFAAYPAAVSLSSGLGDHYQRGASYGYGM